MHRLLSLPTLITSLWLTQPANVVAAPLSSALPLSAIEKTLNAERAIAPASIANALIDSSPWLLAMGLLLTGGAVSWGIFHYVRQQNWQRIEFLRQAVREFEQDSDIRNALKILDFEEYRDYHLKNPAYGKPVSFHVTDDLLCNALANHDERARQKHQIDYQQDHDTLDPEALRRYQIETALRDWFNKMLNGLEHFGYFLESGLFTEKELKPWLGYWIKLIGDPAYRRPGASRFYDALYSYIHHSGFFGVQKLFERFSYRILPSPYEDTDLVALNITNAYDTRVALTLAKVSYLAYQDKQFVAEVVERWGQALVEQTSRAPQGAQPLSGQLLSEQLLNEQLQNKKQKTRRRKRKKSQFTKQSFVRHNFRYFNNRGRDTQAFIFRTEQFMVLAFRGSQEPKDWLTNVTTQLRNFTIRKDGVSTLSSYKGRVHTGFFLAWAIIEKSVLTQIERWRKECSDAGKTLPPLYITGHSLGGALATMATAALSDNGITVAGVYTYGQPRVGDRTFVNQLNTLTQGKVFRFINNNDIVPHVPPPFSIWNPTRLYGHVGMAKYFDGSGSIRANYKLASRLFDRLLGMGQALSGAGLDLISDHNMEYYISHLDTALREEREDQAAHMIEISDV
ncbi:MAG: lipase family protein [Cyanobacteria bacterium J06649_4]